MTACRDCIHNRLYKNIYYDRCFHPNFLSKVISNFYSIDEGKLVQITNENQLPYRANLNTYPDGCIYFEQKEVKKSWWKRMIGL